MNTLVLLVLLLAVFGGATGVLFLFVGQFVNGRYENDSLRQRDRRHKYTRKLH